MTVLSTPEAREKLNPRGAPYFYSISPGRHLGFRRGAQTWLARKHEPGGPREFHKIGPEEDYDFAAALAEALAWFKRDSEETTVAPSKQTVRLACSRYLTFRYDEKSGSGHRSTKSLFDCYVFKHSVADKLVADLKTADYQAWLSTTGKKLVRSNPDPDPDEARRKGRYTANLCWSFFRAALYHAALTNKTLPAAEWKAVKRLEGGDTKRRETFLTEAESQRLINLTSGDFRDLVVAALLTGARVGELKAMKVRDLDLAEGKWTPSKSKSRKKGRRVRFLDPQAIDLLKRLCAGKDKTDLVFTDNGRDWGSRYDRLWREARAKAKLDPSATFYCLRHTYISNQMKAGVSPLFIAENTGTSVKQIEDHYGHFAEEEKRRLLAQGAMKLEIPESNVVAIG